MCVCVFVCLYVCIFLFVCLFVCVCVFLKYGGILHTHAIGVSVAGVVVLSGRVKMYVATLSIRYTAESQCFTLHVVPVTFYS